MDRDLMTAQALGKTESSKVRAKRRWIKMEKPAGKSLLTLFIALGVMVGAGLAGPGNKASAQRYQTIKEHKPKGNVVNRFGTAVGRVDENGVIYSLYDRSIGSVDADGNIYNVSKMNIGRVKPDGNIVNQVGTKVGKVTEGGTVYNISGQKRGEVREVEDIFMIGGAARLLLLKSD
jgi:hypothetical protein